jgi:apolipoprotein N-acyltransferase
MLRATISGQTCVIAPNGRIIRMAKSFTQAWISAEVPIVKKTAIYTLYGDYLAFVFIFLAAAMLISKALWSTIKR